MLLTWYELLSLGGLIMYMFVHLLLKASKHVNDKD